MMMDRNLKIAVGLIGICVFFVGWFYLENTVVTAGAADNVSGWAWSPNINWVSFNCTNQGCGTPYGVNIDMGTGNFSGYAWSQSVGWINLAPAGPYPAAPNNSVNLNFGNNQVTGWARALSLANGANGGWIKMAGSGYSTTFSGGELRGFAWGEDPIGWISFNSKNCDGDNNGITDQLNFSQCPVGQSISSYAVRVDLTLPTPANFRVTGNICGRLDLAWDDITGENSYTLERAVSGLSNWAGVSGSPLAANSVSYSDILIAPSTSYDYRLKACSIGGFCSGYTTLSIGSVCCPSFNLNSSNSIWATIPAGGVGSVDSTRTTISVPSAVCGFNNPVNLSIQFINGPPGSDTSGFVFHFGKSGGMSTTTLVSSGGVYDTTTFWVTIPDSALRGTYAINIKGDGSIVSNNVIVSLNVDIITPFWREF